MSEQEWIYLGDGVYAKGDGWGVWLHANSHDNPTDRVYLEPPMITRLFEAYVEPRAEDKDAT